MSFGNIRFELLTEEDLSLLACWLQQPHIYPFWNHIEQDELEQDEMALRSYYLAADCQVSGLMVYMNERPVGFVHYHHIGSGHQFHTWASAVGETWGMELLIGDVTLTGIGLAQNVIEKFICKLIREQPKISLLLMSPRLDNKRAIRAYAKADFQPVTELKFRGQNLLLMRRRV